MIIKCEKCNKILMERSPNGIFKFKFGKMSSVGNMMEFIIDMEIHGNIKMVCFRKTCRHINVINFLPFLKEDRV